MVTRCLAGVLVLGVVACGPSGPQPPPTTSRRVVDEIHGERFTDPYRWLEDQDHADVRAWIAAQNQYADAVLARTPPDIGRDFEYFTLRRTGEELGAIYRRPRPESPTDIDPAATYERTVDAGPMSRTDRSASTCSPWRPTARASSTACATAGRTSARCTSSI